MDDKLTWISTEEELPPLRKRVLIWTKDSRLTDWNGDFVHCYIMERIPQQKYGNHIVNYSWKGENGGWEYGHNVKFWAEIGSPNE